MVILIGGVVALFLLYEVFSGMSQQNDGTDFVSALANAIARAEGTSPTANNPGSLTSGDVSSDSIVGVFNSAGVVILDSIESGWKFLTDKLTRILSGNSSVYSPDMTISQFAQTYTGGQNYQSWANTVASQLGVTPDTTLSDAEAQYNGR